MAAMFLRCGSHPLSAAETPPTLGPSPASRKPSSTAHRLKCLLWRRPGSPRRLAAGHGKRLFCRRALCVLQALPSPPDTRAEVAHLSPGRGPPGAPPSAGGSCMHPAAQIPPFLEGLAHARLPGPAAGVVVQGDGGMRPVGGGSGGGCPARGRGRPQQPLGVLPLLLPPCGANSPGRFQHGGKQGARSPACGYQVPSATRRLRLCTEPEEKPFGSCLRSRTPEQLGLRWRRENVPEDA